MGQSCHCYKRVHLARSARWITPSLVLSQRKFYFQWQRNDISTTCHPYKGEKEIKNKSWYHNFNRRWDPDWTENTPLPLPVSLQLRKPCKVKPLLPPGVPGTPARAQRAVSGICLFDFAKGLDFAFCRQTRDGERQLGQAWRCHYDLGWGSFHCHDESSGRQSRSWAGFYNTWHNLYSAAGMMSCHSPFLLEPGSVAASVSPENWG